MLDEFGAPCIMSFNIGALRAETKGKLVSSTKGRGSKKTTRSSTKPPRKRSSKKTKPPPAPAKKRASKRKSTKSTTKAKAAIEPEVEAVDPEQEELPPSRRASATNPMRRLDSILRALPAKELASLIDRMGIRVDKKKRIDTPAQVARALVRLSLIHI